MIFFDFGAFQKIRKMLSREKIIFHMLFGASHGTPLMVDQFLIDKILKTFRSYIIRRFLILTD